MTLKSPHWEDVPLKRVLTYLDDRVELNDTEEYATITVKRRHGGLEEREKLLGHQIKTKKQFRLVPGAFIISRIQCWHQAYAVVPDSVPPNMIASTNYDQFSVSPEVDRRFFWWLSHSPRFTETVRSCAVGVVIEKMVFDRDAWLEKTIPLPLISEQQRIVERIEELAAKIEEARTLRQQTRQEVKVLLGSSVSRICRSPTWKTMTIGELVGEDSLRNGRSVKSSGDFGEVRCLTLSAMRNGRIEISDNKIVPLTLAEAEPFLVRKGDVFVVRGNGSKNLCGMAGLITEDTDSVIFPDLFIHVPLPKHLILPEFFVAAWNSAATREVIEEKAKTTSGIWKVNQGHIISTGIPVPPLSEQRRIVAELVALQAQVDGLKKLQAETAVELDAMLPSILHRAFSGDL